MQVIVWRWSLEWPWVPAFYRPIGHARARPA